jgi:hypothetical protein
MNDVVETFIIPGRACTIDPVHPVQKHRLKPVPLCHLRAGSLPRIERLVPAS